MSGWFDLLEYLRKIDPASQYPCQETDKESKDNERDLDENWKVVEIAKELRENRKRMEDFKTECERIEQG